MKGEINKYTCMYTKATIIKAGASPSATCTRFLSIYLSFSGGFLKEHLAKREYDLSSPVGSCVRWTAA